MVRYRPSIETQEDKGVKPKEHKPKSKDDEQPQAQIVGVQTASAAAATERKDE